MLSGFFVMSLSRRHFLVWSFTAGLLGKSQRLLAALVSPATSFKPPLDSGHLRCLKAWVDTLLPADADSPGAGELEVHSSIADKATSNPKHLKLVRAGCRWLDQQARGHAKAVFAELDEQAREALVRQAENSAPKSLPRVFFQYTREDAFRFYYARPESWAMLDYPGPPQPRGFPDYTQPPRV
jgi:hypothetical protein